MPYVFNAFVFQNLLDQKFFETYGITRGKNYGMTIIS
jgi:hypothetical protein